MSEEDKLKSETNSHHVTHLRRKTIGERFWSRPLDRDLSVFVSTVVEMGVYVPGQAKVTHLHHPLLIQPVATAHVSY